MCSTQAVVWRQDTALATCTQQGNNIKCQPPCVVTVGKILPVHDTRHVHSKVLNAELSSVVPVGKTLPVSWLVDVTVYHLLAREAV